jgi:hypothetical protein
LLDPFIASFVASFVDIPNRSEFDKVADKARDKVADKVADKVTVLRMGQSGTIPHFSNLKERRNVSADARASTMKRRFPRTIGFSRAPAIMHRRSLNRPGGQATKIVRPPIRIVSAEIRGR